MNELALIAIGVVIGASLCLVSGVGALMLWSVFRIRRDNEAVNRTLVSLLQQNTVAMDKLRGEVGLSLSRMDAERLYEASLAIQKSAKSLGAQVAALNKAVFSGAPAGLDVTNPEFTLADEAEDDARMIAERNRWQTPDTMAGLSEEEKARVVSEFFTKRRREVQAGVHAVGSTPPYTGAYEAMQSQQTASSGLPDFAEAAGEDGLDLTDASELKQ